jgi:4,5-DOPA dioxygenase extradiol
MARAPSLFISHGSPMFAVEPGLLGPNLQHLGASLQDLTAIVVVSPHWQTPTLRVTATAHPATIHDFGGFPAPLYEIQYPASGAPVLASEVIDLLARAGLTATQDTQRGLDHGAWVPLRYLKPAADVPVLQVSLPRDLDAAGALALGQALAPLRDQGVLIIGSGSLTHNLYEFRSHIDDPQYAQAFADWVASTLAERDDQALVHYRTLAPHAVRAHPTEEHYLPLLVALGASTPDDTRTRVPGGMTYGVLSMDSVGFGLNVEDERKTA